VSRAHRLLQALPVDVVSMVWNCQAWVDERVEALRGAGLLQVRAVGMRMLEDPVSGG